MPFNPTIYPNTSLAPGINSLGAAFQEWQQKREEQQKLQTYNDAIMQHSGSPEDLQAYAAAAGNPNKQAALAAASAANMHNDIMNAQARQQAAQHDAQLRGVLQQINQRGLLFPDQLKRAHDIANPPPPPPLAVTDLPAPDGGRPVRVIQGGGLHAPQVLSTDEQGNPIVLSPAELDAYHRTGKVPLRTSAKSFQVVNDPNSPLNKDKQKADDLGSVFDDAKKFMALDDQYPQDPSIRDALGKNIAARFQNFINGANAPKRPGAPDASVTTPNVPAVMTPAQAAALPPGTPFTGTDGKQYIR